MGTTPPDTCVACRTRKNGVVPYYISPQSTVVVLPPGRTAGADHHLIDPVAAAEYGLEHGQALSDEVLAAVLADDAIAFAAATGREVRTMPDGTTVRHAVDRILPEEGRWEYIVRPLTELGGFATAKGTASRMEEV